MIINDALQIEFSDQNALKIPGKELIQTQLQLKFSADKTIFVGKPILSWSKLSEL